MALGACHGGRPSFPPPPVLGRSKLGAVDMPIGCALTFYLLLAQIRSPENAQYKFREALWRFT
jgi:hypothetical protein